MEPTVQRKEERKEGLIEGPIGSKEETAVVCHPPCAGGLGQDSYPVGPEAQSKGIPLALRRGSRLRPKADRL